MYVFKILMEREVLLTPSIIPVLFKVCIEGKKSINTYIK